MRISCIYIVLFCGVLLGAACTRQASARMSVRAARTVVSQADSVWAEGGKNSDSVSLAQAYTALHTWRALYADDYAHACYHYGRLLREKEDPVSAMQVFINATHSRTHDYHILGRIYSNMGDIAHLADDFLLAYDMYERSGEMYLHSGDNLLYYYDLNNMAFEAVLSENTQLCFDIINQIEQSYISGFCRTYCYLTRAQAYMKMHAYDSTIYYAQLAGVDLKEETSIMLLLAQAYSYKGMGDSATYYAERVLNEEHTLEEQYNALYILTNDDETKDIKAVRQVAADRSDTQKILEIRQGKLSQATQLLEQDLSRKPDLVWLYTLIATLIFIGISMWIYISRKRKEQKLLEQKIDVLKQAASAMQEKHEELTEHYLIEQKRIEEDIKHTCQLIRSGKNIAKDLEWGDFEKMCDRVDRLFYLLASKLRRKNVLNKTEIRLCVLVLLDMSRAEIADTLPYALSSIGKLKDNTAKLLGTTGKNLHDFLVKMAIEG